MVGEDFNVDKDDDRSDVIIHGGHVSRDISLQGSQNLFLKQTIYHNFNVSVSLERSYGTFI